MALTPVIQFGLHATLGKSVPALEAQCEFCQTDEGLERRYKKWQETAREKGHYTRDAVQSRESKVKGHEPVDPFLPQVLDDQKQAKEQHGT